MKTEPYSNVVRLTKITS